MGKWNLYCSLVAALAVAVLSLPLRAQSYAPLRHRRIVSQINEGQLKRLTGNTHPLAMSRFDRGAAPVDLPMDRMLLVLDRSPEQKAALQQLLDAQQDPSSPEYHKWLTPEEFGERFGASDADLQTVTLWLESQGFQVSPLSAGKTIIEFSGTAGQVQSAFHTEIRKFIVNGEEHWANASDPQIPAALATVISGIATLHNFAKKTQLAGAPQRFEAQVREGAQPQLTNGSFHALAPADFATIYNLNPLYQANLLGGGKTIAVVGRTNINLRDLDQFAAAFGSFYRLPQIILTGVDPGNLGGDEEGEAVLDTTWAGAVAKSATIDLVVSKSTNTTDGVDLSEMYIVNRNFADIMTESFGSCEANFTQAQASFYSSLAEQGAAQGITSVVASGDSGSAGCSSPADNISDGVLSVNMLASNPYVVAVGGTQLNESGNPSQYWSASNTSSGSSALSYIPENVWNESCSISTGGNPCPEGTTPSLWAAGGGASVFYSKPYWQAGVPGIPNDGRRDLPDVSLTAAGHDPYLICLRGSCTPNSRGQISLYGYAGTSAATPSFAGILALALSNTPRLGAINYSLYRLAATQDWSQCNGSNPAALPASNCIFYDVTAGSNAVPGVGGGAYQATFGYDLATGLGSVNAANLSKSLAFDPCCAGNLTSSKSALSFGTAYIGTSQSQQITLTNSGLNRILISSQFLSGPDYNQFSAALTCGINIAPGASCLLNVKFKPTSAGAKSATINLLAEFAASYTFMTISVSGTGAVSSTALLSSNVVNFGNRKILTRDEAQAVTISNTTGRNLNLGNLSVSGLKNDFPFASSCPTTLTSGSTCTLYVSFVPQLIGTRAASIAIPVDSSGTVQNISLTGNGRLDGAFEIVNSLTAKVLEVSGPAWYNGALVEQSGLNGLRQQQWEFVPVNDGFYQIRNVLTGKVLDVTGASSSNSAFIQQFDYLGSANQQWQLVPVDDVHYKIVNRGSGKVLDLPFGSRVNGTPIQQWDYLGNGQQQWVLVPARSYTILNNLSLQVIDVQGGSGFDGASIQQWYSNGYKQQHWQFMPVGEGYYAIVNRLTGKVLDVIGGSFANGTAIQQFGYLGGPNQQWQFVPLDATSYKIVNRLTGKALDDKNYSIASGSTIQQWDYAGGANQQWRLQPVTLYAIMNKQSGLVLDVPGGTGEDGVPIQQYQFFGNQQQEWVVVNSGGGYQTIMNDLTNRMIGPGNLSNDNGSEITQSGSSGTDNQQWRFVPLEGDYYEILNKRSGKVLDVKSGSVLNGAPIQQYEYLDFSNQQWRLVPISN